MPRRSARCSRATSSIASDVIGRYGGTIEKFIGDAVMAVWGTPVAHEDDAERSVRAALELVDAVKALGPTIQARAGILTGEAAVTLGATDQGMVAGDLVNTAARLQSVAIPGTVLVGEGTARATEAAIAYEPIGEQTLKGKTAPVPAWRAVRVVAERGGRNRSHTLEAPFVGRDEELRLLKDLFHATGRERRARLVSVVGPAGIGKSRLAWEFTKYLDGVTEDIYWHDGRSPSYGEGVTFWALGEMVRGRAGLAESDDETTTRRKIAESVAVIVSDETERRWIESALLALLGYGATLGADQLFAAWRTYFERLAATGSVVMVFEDLHWADTGTIDFVEHLLEWSKGVPIYVVTLARPGAARAPPGVGRGQAHLRLDVPRAAARTGDGGPPRRARPGSARSRRQGDRRTGRWHPAVRGRDRPDAGGGRSDRRGRRGLSTGRRPGDAGRPGDAHGAHRGAPRRPGRGGSRPAAARGHPRSELRGSGACGRLRGGRGRPRRASCRSWSGGSC